MDWFQILPIGKKKMLASERFFKKLRMMNSVRDVIFLFK